MARKYYDLPLETRLRVVTIKTTEKEMTNLEYREELKKARAKGWDIKAYQI